jgi:predicted phosphodiesterase
MGSEGEITIERKKIAFTHYPEIANSLAGTDMYDLVFYGHTHRYKINRVNEKTCLINPGDISGRYGKSSFIFYELSTGEIEKIDL